MGEFVQELETEGWHLKVGDVYANPFHYTSFKILKIELSSDNDAENSRVYGCRVDIETQKEMNDLEEYPNEWVRPWYLADYFALDS